MIFVAAGAYWGPLVALRIVSGELYFWYVLSLYWPLLAPCLLAFVEYCLVARKGKKAVIISFLCIFGIWVFGPLAFTASGATSSEWIILDLTERGFAISESGAVILSILLIVLETVFFYFFTFVGSTYDGTLHLLLSITVLLLFLGAVISTVSWVLSRGLAKTRMISRKQERVPVTIMKKKTEYIIASVVFFTLVSIGLWHLGARFGSGADAQKELLTLWDNFETGQTPQEVKEIFKEQEFKHLTLLTLTEKTWDVATPFRLGAENWILRIEYNESGVDSLRIRTLDGMHIKSKEAPEDRVSEDF